MSTVVIQYCGFCKTLFSNTRGHVFNKIPAPDLEKIREEITEKGHRVYVIKKTEFPRRCPDCQKIKKEVSKGRPSPPPPSHETPDPDADGSWGNAVRASEKD